MGFYLSPLVDIKEVDLTNTIPAVATSIACIVLRNTYKGPENKKTLITDVNRLIDTFGEPRTTMYTNNNVDTETAYCYQDMLAASGYLKYGNKLYCTRTMPVSATFSGTKAVTGTNPTFDAFTGYTGAHVSYTLSDLASEDPDYFNDDVSVSTDHSFYFIAGSRGNWGNNIRLGVINFSAYNQIVSGGNSTWDTYEEVYDNIDSPLESNKEFLVIVQVKDQGESSWETKEVFNVSTDEDKKDDQGRTMFAETVINQESEYIRMAMKSTQKNIALNMATQSWQQFGGGYDYSTNEDAYPSDSIIIDGYELYQNPEEIDVNIFIDSNKSDTVKSTLNSICADTRKDCMAILDCQYGDVVNNKGNEATDLRTYRTVTLNINSSYSTIFGNWFEVYDKWNQKYRWIPASGHMAGIFARTDSVSEPWFAPAGLNRAIITNIRKLAWNPTLGERDILYKNGINPIVSFSGQGKVVWGQKTLLDKSSAFNRINVRRLFLVLEKAISTASKYFLFEPNDDITRFMLVNMIEPFLRDVKGRRGVYDFAVICDETNNTPERIDRNELWVDIYIKPVRAAEFIVLRFIATKTGASFSEIAGLTNT